MKFFLPVLMLIFVAISCSHTDNTKPDNNNGFLSKAEVLDLFLNQNDESLEMTEDVIERLNNLVPENQFVDNELLEQQEDEIKSGEFEGVEIADQVDLREWANPTILNQLNGRCTAYSMVATLELLACKKYGYCDHKLSEAHSWSYDKNYSCKTKVNSHLKNYTALSKYWPHDKKYPEVYDVNDKGFVRIEHGWYLKDNETKVIESLNLGLPVYIGMRTPVSMLSCKATVSPNSAPADGGHALSVVGYYHYPEHRDLNYVLILKNSWGKNCGDKGYQYLPMSLCKKDGFYCMFWAFDKLKFKDENQTSNKDFS